MRYGTRSRTTKLTIKTYLQKSKNPQFIMHEKTHNQLSHDKCIKSVELRIRNRAGTYVGGPCACPCPSLPLEIKKIVLIVDAKIC